MAVKMTSTLTLTVSISVVLLFNHFACGVARAGLKGACAKVDITPPLGITQKIKEYLAGKGYIEQSE